MARQRRNNPTSYSNTVDHTGTSQRRRARRRRSRESSLEQVEREVYLTEVSVAQQLGFIDRPTAQQPDKRPLKNQDTLFEPQIGSYADHEIHENPEILPSAAHAAYFQSRCYAEDPLAALAKLHATPNQHTPGQNYTNQFLEEQWQLEKSYHLNTDTTERHEVELGRLLCLEEELNLAWNTLLMTPEQVLVQTNTLVRVLRLLEEQRSVVGTAGVADDLLAEQRDEMKKIWYLKTKLRKLFLALVEEKKPLLRVCRAGESSTLGTRGQQKLQDALRKRAGKLCTVLESYNSHVAAFQTTNPNRPVPPTMDKGYSTWLLISELKRRKGGLDGRTCKQKFRPVCNPFSTTNIFLLDWNRNIIGVFEGTQTQTGDQILVSDWNTQIEQIKSTMAQGCLSQIPGDLDETHVQLLAGGQVSNPQQPAGGLQQNRTNVLFYVNNLNTHQPLDRGDIDVDGDEDAEGEDYVEGEDNLEDNYLADIEGILAKTMRANLEQEHHMGQNST
ncbi:hypothetical protein PtA15_16A226 [Puccinia triticina]|uniref:Uncharacterized protein n=1 Tax=Puccinia triticina TaxID=208348 RepID=A0ABY7D510_9BASI|nr:uncharacterized protein PtA15_16A226 [Puccinia triticina]WAQ92320.1 hypothetical protein PtA15_16A226 [Puccinia triticina]